MYRVMRFYPAGELDHPRFRIAGCATVQDREGAGTSPRPFPSPLARRPPHVFGELAGRGCEAAPAGGAFYTFVKVKGDDMGVAARWLEKGHVAVNAGVCVLCAGKDSVILRCLDRESERGDGADQEGWVNLSTPLKPIHFSIRFLNFISHAIPADG
jgi:hypothetical protein